MSGEPDFGVTPTLRGERVTLVPVTADAADVLMPLMADPEVSRLTGSVHSTAEALDAAEPWSLDELREIYGRWATASDRLVWTIVENATGRVVGESVLNDLDVGNRSCGFRIWIAGARGRGLGTEATRLTVEHGFAAGVHRIALEVYAFNPAAQRVYEKVGFRREGVLRDALRFDDEWVDAYAMALLSTDPRD